MSLLKYKAVCITFSRIAVVQLMVIKTDAATEKFSSTRGSFTNYALSIQTAFSQTEAGTTAPVTVYRIDKISTYLYLLMCSIEIN